MSILSSGWLDKSVVLRVPSGRLNVPLRFVLLGESDDKLHVRMGDCWDVDVYKDMVQGVEADRQCCPC